MTNTEKGEREDNLVTGSAAPEQDGTGDVRGGEYGHASETEAPLCIDLRIEKGVEQAIRQQKDKIRRTNMPSYASAGMD